MAAAMGLNVARLVREELIRTRSDLAAVGDLLEERARQDEKWGEQNHPDVPADILGARHAAELAARFFGVPTSGVAKRDTELATANGQVTYAHIAVEELAEAIEAAALGDEDALRTEVIQLAAVCVQWAQAIDRRRASGAQ